jgi:hypothetical protein
LTCLSKLLEGQLGRGLDAEDEGVEEEANQGLGLGAGAVGDGRADEQIALAGEAVEQHREGREQGHEEGDALAAGEVAQGGAERRREGDDPARAPVGRHRGARAICREIQGEGAPSSSVRQ